MLTTSLPPLPLRDCDLIDLDWGLMIPTCSQGCEWLNEQILTKIHKEFYILERPLTLAVFKMNLA